MIQRKKPRFLFLRMAVFFFAVFLISACTTEKTPVFPESSSPPIVVTASASDTEKTDGSFSVRFYLPNGEDKYTIEAVSSDGTMKKSITFEVKKDTK